VNFVQEFWQALDLIDDNHTIFGCKFLRHTPRVLIESQIGRSIEKIIEPYSF
jgi:hypothetical protein